MIQDITPHTYHNEYRPIPPDRDSILLCYRVRQALVSRVDDVIAYPTFEEAEACADKWELYTDYTYLFSIDGKRFYLGDDKIADKIMGGLRPSKYTQRAYRNTGSLRERANFVRQSIISCFVKNSAVVG